MDNVIYTIEITGSSKRNLHIILSTEKTTDSPENSLKHLILCSYHHKGSVAIKFCLKRSPYFHFGPGGVLNFGLGRGVPLGILKCHHPSPIHVPILKEKWPIHVPRYMRSGPSMYRGVQFLTTHTCTCWKKFTHEGTRKKLKLQSGRAQAKWNVNDRCTGYWKFTTHWCTNDQKWPIDVPQWKKWPIDVPIKTGTPIHVPHFRKKKEPIDVPGSLILRPMFAAHPYNHFCTEYPPGFGHRRHEGVFHHVHKGMHLENIMFL